MIHNKVSKISDMINDIGRIKLQPLLNQEANVTLQKVKDRHGKYPNDVDWAKLQPETINNKKSGDTPLLETGELQGSYQKSVQNNAYEVGSNNDKAVWMEFGTVDIPARPVLQPENNLTEARMNIALEKFLNAKLSQIWQ